MDVRKIPNLRARWWCAAAACLALVAPAHAARPNPKALGAEKGDDHGGPPGKALRYTVISGDSLWSIAQDHGCRVDDLRRANELVAGTLLVGTRLTIPTCKGPAPQGDALTRPARKKPSRQHQVARGDTLSSIAGRYDTTIEDLRTLNGLRDDVIHPGQRLAVGGSASMPAIRLVAGQSIGRPQRGSLLGGVQLPRSAQYYRRRPEWAWGAQHVVDHVLRAIAEVNRAHPSVHRLAIGDISSPKGGVLPGHGSHQSGRDIDLGLYFTSVPSGYPDEFVRAKSGRLDAAANWTLVHALYLASKSPGGPERIFLDYDVQGQLYKLARKLGLSRAVLKKIFQYPDGRWAQDRLVQHEPKHDDHLHVRFACPPKDEKCR